MKLGKFTLNMMLCWILAISFSVSTHSKIAPETVVGQWLFNEDKGDKAIDSSGNRHDGQIKGAGMEYWKYLC